MGFYEKLLKQEKEISVKEFARGYALSKTAIANVSYYDCEPIETFANAVYNKYNEDESFARNLDDVIDEINGHCCQRLFRFAFTEGFEERGFYILTNSVYLLRKKYYCFNDEIVKNDLDRIYDEITSESEITK